MSASVKTENQKENIREQRVMGGAKIEETKNAGFKRKILIRGMNK